MPPPAVTPSRAFREWDTTRRDKLDKIEGRCVWAAELTPLDDDLAAEHLRAYVMLLSAHFQGFCRDLYIEATAAVAGRIKQKGLWPIIQAQFDAELCLDRANPSLDTLVRDFRRVGIDDLRAALGVGPPADVHKGRLGTMIGCRNKCAHGEPFVPELLLPNIQAWRASCDWMASKLDEAVYNRLRMALRASPW